MLKKNFKQIRNNISIIFLNIFLIFSFSYAFVFLIINFSFRLFLQLTLASSFFLKILWYIFDFYGWRVCSNLVLVWIECVYWEDRHLTYTNWTNEQISKTISWSIVILRGIVVGLQHHFLGWVHFQGISQMIINYSWQNK